MNCRVYFTDSFHSSLLFIPRYFDPDQSAFPSSRPVQRIHTGDLFATQPGQFRANGLTVLASNATHDTLLVANTHNGNLYKVEVMKPAAAAVGQAGWAPGLSGLHDAVMHALPGAVPAAQVTELALPAVQGRVAGHLLLDGLWTANSSFVYASDNMNNRVWGVELGGGHTSTSARLSCLFHAQAFATPTTLAMAQGLLWAVNAHLDSCFPFLPCPTHAFELVGLDPRACVPWP